MDSVSVHQQLLETKEDQQKLLLKQYEALNQQLLGQLNEADKITTKQLIEQKEKEIKELTEEIEKRRNSKKQEGEFYRVYHKHWETSLPKIDFKRSKPIIENVLGKLREDQESSALFLLQNSASMEGKLCVERIVSYLHLQEMGTLVAPCIVEFLPHQLPDELKFLNALATRFEVQPLDENLQRYIQAVLDKLCDSLCSGDILLVQLGIYRLNSQDRFLEWFVNDFWQTLTKERLPQLGGYPFIKIVGVITIGNLVAKSFLPDNLCCKKQNFDGGKILQLPLQKWTEADIRDWLLRFSRLTEPSIGLTKTDIEEMARSIHEVTEGKPSHVRSELMNVMTRCVS